ncbi:hypothetical protein SAMN05216228_106420 [Rhizobium tibeticum]|uniref:Transposase n=1 Tax=Rhizobium tibeticum TaxID=501024 RepID=A0A1H8WIM8_9HYPH|nr:Transposase [Rhizobium tibeticum]SEP26938.1 hypothetical protein SAMN05216228_106420 [Rhizobium tibeticum]
MDIWFCERFAAFEQRASATFRNRHIASAGMQTDYAGHRPGDRSGDGRDPAGADLRRGSAGLFVHLRLCKLHSTAAGLDRGSATGAELLRWRDQGDLCDNLKAGVAKPLWFEPTINATFAAFAEHYDTTILPTRPKRPKDKAKVEGSVLIVERWILARLRNDLQPRRSQRADQPASRRSQ